MNHKNLGPLAVVGAAFLWSLDGFLRRNLYSLPPTVVVFWEHVFGFLVIAPIVMRSWRRFLTLSKTQWMAIIAVAFLSGALGTMLYTGALAKIQYLPFSVVVLLQQLQPLFAIGTAIVLLREPLTPRFGILASLALIAAYFVSFPNLTVNLTAGNGTLVAALMALGAAACWGTSTAFSKYALYGAPVEHITTLRFGFTAIFALIMTLLLGHALTLTALTQAQWLYIIAITFSTGLVALTLYYFGLKRVPASLSTLLELTWPLSAVAVGYLFLGETLSLTQWIGSVALVAIMYILVSKSRA